MKKYLLAFLLLSVHWVQAQQKTATPEDTLFNKLPSLPNDTNKLVKLKKLAMYYENANINRDFECCAQGLKLATSLNNNKYICFFRILNAQAFINKGDFNGALKRLDTAYNFANEHHEKRMLAFACGDIGLTYQNIGNYTKALQYLVQFLSLAEQINDHQMTCTAAVNVGTVYANQENNEKCIYYANLVLNTIRKYHLHIPIVETKAYELLGTTYSKQKKVKEAKAAILKALAIYQSEKNDVGIAMCYSYLSSFYPPDYVGMLNYGLKAQAMWDKLAPDNFYSIGNMGNVGSAYGNLVRFNQWQAVKDSVPLSVRKKVYLQKALQYINRGINVARATNSKFYIMTLSDSLAKLEAFTGEYKDAFTRLEQRNVLYDSIYSQDTKNKIAGIEEEHEISLRDKQLLINKLQIANQRKQAIMLVGLVVMLLGISIIIYLQSRLRRRTNAALRTLNTELDQANRVKMKFFSILNHDLKQPVAGFVHLLHLQENEPELLNETNRQQFQKRITSSAENLLEKMEDLLLWAKGQMENFNPQLKDIPVETLFSHIANFFETSGVEIQFESPAGMSLHTDEYCIKTIAQNLTGNAIKALAKTESPLIIWEAWEADGKKYLCITDNGPGASNEQLRALYDDAAAIGIQQGLGLHIVRDMAKAIGFEVIVVPQEHAGLKIQLETGA